jgi:hypothetical protein
VVGRGAILPAGKSRVPSPDKVTGFFDLPHASIRREALVSNQPLTKINITNLPWGKRQQEGNTDNLNAIYELSTE